MQKIALVFKNNIHLFAPSKELSELLQLAEQVEAKEKKTPELTFCVHLRTKTSARENSKIFFMQFQSLQALEEELDRAFFEEEETDPAETAEHSEASQEAKSGNTAEDQQWV